jgi:hypothetical protein
MNQLPTTGTSDLLERLSPYIPDDLINSLFVNASGPGRRRRFSAAQLFRVWMGTRGYLAWLLQNRGCRRGQLMRLSYPLQIVELD